MTSDNWVSLIALVGWLVLVLNALRARRLGARKITVLGLVWLAIFLLTVGAFTAIGQ